MKTQRALTGVLSQAERAQLAEQGWLLLPGVAAAASLPAMHAAWERVEAKSEPNGANFGPSGLEEEPLFRACLEEPRVAEAVRALLGDESRLQICKGRAPPRGHGRQGLHIDWSEPVPPERQILANVFVLLDDMDEENGATRLVPGSHRWHRAPRGNVAQPHGAHREERAMRGRAGDALIFSGHLWHSGTENRSGRRRRVAIGVFSRIDLPWPKGAG
jgi:hypothetical protein